MKVNEGVKKNEAGKILGIELIYHIIVGSN